MKNQSSSKLTNGNGKSKNGDKPVRIGDKFHEEINDIIRERMVKWKLTKADATSKITNLITRHKLWNDIKNSLINADEKEVERYG